MNKKRLGVAVFLVLFALSAHTTEAFSLKSFFSNLFGSKPTEVKQGAAAYRSVSSDSELQMQVTDELSAETPTIKTEPVKEIPVKEEVIPIRQPVNDTPTIDTPIKPIKPTKSTVKSDTIDISIPIKQPIREETVKPIKTVKEIKVEQTKNLVVYKIVKFGMKNDTDVKTVQKRLKELGFLKGIADGNYGRGTVVAVSSFQTSVGLKVDGMKVDEKTLAALRIRLIQRTTNTTTDPEKILFLGGEDGPVRFNDVFSSSDMYGWPLVSPNAPSSVAKWSPRANSQGLYFDNKYWIIGGFGQSINGDIGDVWSSPDGITWTQMPIPPFQGYTYYKTAVFNNRIYVIGGYNTYMTPAHIWSTSDGITWTTLSSSAPFGVRGSGQIVTAFNGKLYVINGSDGSSNYHTDTWATADGSTWTQIANNTAIGDLSYSSSVIFNNKVYLLSGQSSVGGSDDIWSSPDMINWTLVTQNPGFTIGGTINDVIVAHNKIWVATQASGPSGQNFLYSSSDGVNWTQSCAVLPWTPRMSHRMISNGGTPANTPDPCVQQIPSITVTSPNGGEVFQAGQPITVNWTSSGIIGPVGISLITPVPGGYAGWVLSNSHPNTGQETFTLPTTSQWTGMPYGQNFKISVYSIQSQPPSYSYAISDDSDNLFTINQQVPTLTIASSASMPQTQNVQAGTSNVKLAEYDYTADQALAIEEFTMTLQQMNPTNPSAVSNFKLKVNGTQVGQTIVNPAVYPFDQSTNNTFGDYMSGNGLHLTFQAGETKKISLYADIRSTAINGTEINILRPGGPLFDPTVPGYTSVQMGNAFDSNIFTVMNQTTSDQILFIGGTNSVGGYHAYNDIYSSNNMQSWVGFPIQPMNPVRFSERENPQALYYNNKYWVIGGSSAVTARLTDVWNSTDGITWTQVSATVPFSAYYRYKAIVFNNKIYVIGGRENYNGGTAPAKVWSTTDGINWVTTTAPFYERENPTLGILNNKLYVIGGVQGNSGPLLVGCTSTSGFSSITGLSCNPSGGQFDMWQTDDGITWIKTVDYAPWGRISDAKILNFNNAIYLLGGVKWSIDGQNGASSSDIWKSTNGSIWTKISQNLPVPVAQFTNIDAVVANGKMWVGDFADVNPHTNHLWSSTDGMTWTQLQGTLPWSPRHGYKMVVK